MLDSCTSFSHEFSALFHPFGNEYDLERRHPEAVTTLVNLTGYVAYIDDLRTTLRPEIELISTRIIAPAKELETLLKAIEKAITKREHKLLDFDRHTNSYNKLKEKQNRSAKDDQNMFKLEQDCEVAATDYEHHNNLLKAELPQFLALATKMITPLFYSFYYMQLNVFYLSMDKLKAYAEGKFDLSENNLISHEHKFAMDMSRITAELESFSIQKPPAHSARILQLAKAGQPLSARPKGKQSSGPALETAKAPTSPPVTAPAAAAAVPAASSSVPPPAYTPGDAGVVGSADKPSTMSADYVVALYDYTATAAGDLSFKAGDRIEVLQRTPSTEDWWTGRLNGVQGVFPGNYVREA